MDKRSWNILCWNIRGINASSKWDEIQQKIRKVPVLWFVYRKLSVNLLTQLLFKISLPNALINLNSSPLWVSLVVSLSFGIAQFSWVMLWLLSLMLLQLISLLVMIEVTGV